MRAPSTAFRTAFSLGKFSPSPMCERGVAELPDASGVLVAFDIGRVKDVSLKCDGRLVVTVSRLESSSCCWHRQRVKLLTERRSTSGLEAHITNFDNFKQFFLKNKIFDYRKLCGNL